LGLLKRTAKPLPVPPRQMRELIGRAEAEAFEHAVGEPVFPTVSEAQYESLLDFGCGCGRIARQLAVAAAPTPGRYVGIDLHAGMIAWANENLAPRLPNFAFLHANVFNPGFNPDPALPRTAPFPVEDASVTLLLALSVFTHLLQRQAEYYLDEVKRVLRPDGVMIASFFLFEKAGFPMMQDFQNALYINDSDPTNAVLFDREWLVGALAARELRIRVARPPGIRGFQWEMEIEAGVGSVPLPPDEAPLGRRPPPVCGAPPHTIGAGSNRLSRLRRKSSD
jgi:SAM-dependent methyltransferase